MNTTKLVSIVLPVYNGERYIADAIKSILDQSYKEFELIIVNDCSNDKTADIADTFANLDSRIKIITNSTNLKLPKSLNVGFKHANGEFFTWTSDDNMYKPNAIETMVTYLEKHPSIDMVYSNYTNIDENGNILECLELESPHYMVSGNVCGASFMYTRRIADIVGEYDENLFLAEDYDYWIRINSKGEISHITDDLYLYRCHSGSLTSTKQELVRKQTYKTVEKNFLNLYADAKKNHNVRLFFNRFLEYGSSDYQNILEKLLVIDRDYRIYNALREFRNRIRKRI